MALDVTAARRRVATIWSGFTSGQKTMLGLAVAAVLYPPLLALAGALHAEDLARLQAAADRLPAGLRRLTERGLALVHRLAHASPCGRSRSPERRPLSGRDGGAGSAPDPGRVRPASPRRSIPE